MNKQVLTTNESDQNNNYDDFKSDIPEPPAKRLLTEKIAQNTALERLKEQ